MFFCCLVSGPTSPEWIKNKVTWICGYQNCPLRDYQLQFINPGADFEFFVSVGGCVCPEIGQIHSGRVHFISMPAIVLDFLSAVAAGLDWQPDFVKHLGHPPGIIQQGIMGRVQLFAPRIGPFHGKRDPVTKVKSFFQNRGKLNGQLWGRIQKKRSARLQYTAAFMNPFPAPVKINRLRYFVVIAVFVILSNVEWRVCKDGVDYAWLHLLEQLETVGVEKNPP